MRTLTPILSLLICTLFISSAHAQQWVEQVIVLNEGHYDNVGDSMVTPVSVGSYDPLSGNYTSFATIDDVRFASDVIIDGDFIYVAADKYLIKYHRDTYVEVGRQTIPGIRKLAAYQDQILVTRGEYLTNYDSYFQVYLQSDLSLLYSLDTMSTGIKFAAEGITVDADSAFIAVNNGFVWGAEVGYLVSINLIDQSYVRSIDLGGGRNPDNLMRTGCMIYTLNNESHNTSTLSMYDIATRQMNHFQLGTMSGCNGSFYANDKIYYQAAFSDTNYTPSKTVSRFDPVLGSILDTIDFGKAFYGMDNDPLSNKIYAATTNYVDAGTVFIYSLDGVLEDSFAVSAAPGEFAFDLRATTGIKDISKRIEVDVFPNPMKDQVFVHWTQSTGQAGEAQIILSSLLGQQIIQINTTEHTQAINTKDLSSGIYVLEVRTEEGVSTQKLIK